MYNPTFYDPNKIGSLYLPRFKQIEAEADALKVTSSAKDSTGNKVALLLIDMQIDFCHKNGELYVPGAEDDIRRLITLILRELPSITSIFASLDSHLLFQIFFRTWWQLTNGEKPDLFTEIYKESPPNKHPLAKSINDNDIRPVIDPIWSVDYPDILMKQANKPLCIWPYHTQMGTPGQALDPALYEILAFHAFARKTQLNFLQKGQIPSTEMYGILCPEVKIPNHKQGGFNIDFLKMIMKYDKILIAGQAKSHCVLASILQIYDYFKNDKDALKKIHILEDCMSSVKHPMIDFEKITCTAFDQFRNSGINIIKSTDISLTI
jgi:nicotinamidase-related amidase